jgi:hypothetical protein
MSTDPNGTSPTGATPAEPFPAPVTTDPASAAGTTDPATAAGPTGADDVLSSGEGAEGEDEGFFARHSGLITAAMTAVIVAAVAIAGLWLWRDHVADQNAATEAAFSKQVEQQGASVDTVECDGGTCSAIIGGQAYSVLVQKDAQGKQHFGVASYAGN